MPENLKVAPNQAQPNIPDGGDFDKTFWQQYVVKYKDDREPLAVRPGDHVIVRDGKDEYDHNTRIAQVQNIIFYRHMGLL